MGSGFVHGLGSIVNGLHFLPWGAGICVSELGSVFLRDNVILHENTVQEAGIIPQPNMQPEKDPTKATVFLNKGCVSRIDRI